MFVDVYDIFSEYVYRFSSLHIYKDVAIFSHTVVTRWGTLCIGLKMVYT